MRRRLERRGRGLVGFDCRSRLDATRSCRRRRGLVTLTKNYIVLSIYFKSLLNIA